MLNSIYPFISTAVIFALAAFVALLVSRMIFSYADPNPFGKIGKLSFQIRKVTERFVYPAARLLAQFRIDPRWAPIVTILITCILAYFALGIVRDAFFIVDGLTSGIMTGNIERIVGIFLYAILSVFTLFIFIRFISSWFVFAKSSFLSFVQRVTDPVLLPIRRLIPPLGMIDISAMLLLLLIGFLQSIILRTFVYS